MLITKKSPRTGKENTLDLPITQEQLDNWQAGTLIQNAMPNLDADQREFLITGLTKEDWDEIFGGEK